jgi:carboxypeptidase Taq
MIKAIGKSPDKPAQEILARNYDVQKQWDFGMRVLADMGFDLEAGRQDRSAHPFTVGVHPLDVRLTTRLAVNEFAMGLFATMHEGGHGLFEQGYHPDHQDTVLAQAPSLGIHESQSRLWENQVGRSRAFWRHYYPSLQSIFPEALGSTPEVDFYRAINTVRPSLIRVEADEATYALHIVLRFEIECGLIEGSVEVDDLPDLWNAKMKEYLGIEPSNDAEGVLQDVHWSHGLIGYFPTYALGNIYSAQIFDRIRADLGDPGALIERGELASIREWLRVNIHHAGRTRTADELIKDVCGESLNPEPLLGYMAGKFGAVYEVGL